jgi:signal transduction histidine kinase
MAASVAPEVRNPLHSIRLIVDEQRHDVPALAHHPLRHDLEGCLQRIDHAVDLVYALARPGAEEGNSADLVAIVHEGVALLTRASPDGPEIALEKLPSRAVVAAAPARVRIVVENILRNASQASRAGGRIDVHLVRDANQWVLDVRNPGSLGPLDDDVRESAGLGFGLSISRRIVTDAGGHLQLTERDGHVHCVVHWPVPNGAMP